MKTEENATCLCTFTILKRVRLKKKLLHLSFEEVGITEQE